MTANALAQEWRVKLASTGHQRPWWAMKHKGVSPHTYDAVLTAKAGLDRYVRFYHSHNLAVYSPWLKGYCCPNQCKQGDTQSSAFLPRYCRQGL